MLEIAREIFRYANRHYCDGGWDVIVECWDTEMLVDYLVRWDCTTVEDAFDAVKDLVDVWADRQMDAINSAF